MSKRKIGSIKGMPVVEGYPNEVTKFEYHYKEDNDGNITLSKRDSKGNLENLGSSDNASGSNKNVKYYGIGVYFRGLHVSTSECLKIGQLGSIIPISVDYRTSDAMSNNGLGYFFYYNRPIIETTNPSTDVIIKCTPSSVLGLTNSDEDYKVMDRIDYDGVIDFITKFKELCDENGMSDGTLEQLVSLKEELVELTEEEYFKYLEDIGVYNSIFN